MLPELGYFNSVIFHIRGLKRPKIRDIYPLQCEFCQWNLAKKIVFYPPESYFYRETPSKRQRTSFELQLGGFCCENLATLDRSIRPFCLLRLLQFISNRCELYLYIYSHHSLLQCPLSRPEYLMLVILALLRRENV